MTGRVGGKLGILAGGGTLPRAVADAAASAGRQVHILAFEGFCEPATVASYAHDWIGLAKVGRLFAALRAARAATNSASSTAASSSVGALPPSRRGIHQLSSGDDGRWG